MMERHDIDALLIGSLYGELSPADEARLQAHLESHPSDRTVLADLSRAREVVRESRLLQFQAEPPQAITSILLQEAARRAPKKREDESWFQRFVRSFMAHPAMAAAAMLVVVIGVAGTAYLRKGDQFAEQTKESAPAALESRDEAAGEAPAASTPASPVGEAAFQTEGNKAGEQQVAQGSAYSVTLSDDFRKGSKAADQPVDVVKLGAADSAEVAEAKPTTRPAPAKPAVQSQTAVKPEPKLAPGRHIVVTTPDRAPKDLDEARLRRDDELAKKQPKLDIASDRGGDDLVAREMTGTAGGIAMPEEARPFPAATPAPPPSAPAPVAASVPETAAAPNLDRNYSRSVPAPERRLVEKPTDKKPADKSARAAGVKQKNETENTVGNEWAKTEHAKIAARVRAGNCRDAAGLAVVLSNRAPGYYQNNVATDRELQKCKQYIETEREKDAELRAQRERASRARNTESTTKKAAPAAPADTSAK
jgi:anti-sigma factor RsiW